MADFQALARRATKTVLPMALALSGLFSGTANAQQNFVSGADNNHPSTTHNTASYAVNEQVVQSLFNDVAAYTANTISGNVAYYHPYADNAYKFKGTYEQWKATYPEAFQNSNGKKLDVDAFLRGKYDKVTVDKFEAIGGDKLARDAGVVAANNALSVRFDPGDAIYVGNIDFTNFQTIVNQHYSQWRGSSHSMITSASNNNPVDQYTAKAQAVFATDANGVYTAARTPKIQSIVDNVIKLYNQAGPQYEHTPGFYAPMRQYFQSLKPGQEQDVALMVVNELSPAKPSDHNAYPRNSSSLSTLVADYALNLQTAKSEGYSTIADRFRNGVLVQPVTSNLNPERLRVRITLASMLNIPYPPPQTLATASLPGGQ